MKLIRIAIVSLLIGGITTPSWAGDLRESIAKAAEQQAAAPDGASSGNGGSPALKWSGRGLFVAGMAVGLYGFINDKNGKYSEFGEASSSNKHLGAAGVSAAFVGGVLMLLGTRHSGSASRTSSLPAVAASPGSVSISKNVTW
jgi:hypothetical protein